MIRMTTWRRHPKIIEIPTELNIRRLWECEQLVTIMISPGVGYFSIVPIRTWRQVGVQQRGPSFRNWDNLVVLECVTRSCKTEIGSKWRKWSSRFFKDGQELERKTWIVQISMIVSFGFLENIIVANWRKLCQRGIQSGHAYARLIISSFWHFFLRNKHVMM